MPPQGKKHWLNLACLPKIKSNKYPLRFTFLLLQSNLQGSRVQIYEWTSEFSFLGPHGLSCLQNPKKLQHSRAPGTFCVFFCPFYFLHFRGKNWQSYLFTGKKTASKVVVILTMKLLERVLYQFLPIWIHPTKPNQNYWSKQSTPGSVVPRAMFHLVHSPTWIRDTIK